MPIFVSLGRVEEVIRFIESRYVDTVTSDTLMEEAVRHGTAFGSIAYLSPAELKSQTKPWMAALKALALKSYYIQDTVVVPKVVKTLLPTRPD